MPVAEAELRPKKASFHLKSAETILDEVMVALGQDSPKSAQSRSAVLAVMRKSLAEARQHCLQLATLGSFPRATETL